MNAVSLSTFYVYTAVCRRVPTHCLTGYTDAVSQPIFYIQTALPSINILKPKNTYLCQEYDLALCFSLETQQNAWN